MPVWLEQNERREIIDYLHRSQIVSEFAGNYKTLTFILVEVGSHWKIFEQKRDTI